MRKGSFCIQIKFNILLIFKVFAVTVSFLNLKSKEQSPDFIWSAIWCGYVIKFHTSAFTFGGRTCHSFERNVILFLNSEGCKTTHICAARMPTGKNIPRTSFQEMSMLCNSNLLIKYPVIPKAQSKHKRLVNKVNCGWMTRRRQLQNI